MSSAVAYPASSRADGVVEVREEQPVADEPRPVAADDDVLAERAAQRPRRGHGLQARLSTVQTTSTTGALAGCMKCRPTTSRGRPVAAASSMTGRLAAVGGEHRAGSAHRVQLREHRPLDVGVLRDRLDDRSTSDRADRPVPPDARTTPTPAAREDGHDLVGHEPRPDDADGARPRASGAPAATRGQLVGHDDPGPRPLVRVEAPPALAAQQPRGDQLAQHGRGGVPAVGARRAATWCRGPRTRCPAR